MKTLREMMDQLDEISRRDVLRGAGAAALAGATQNVGAYTRYPKAIQYDEDELTKINTFLMLRQFCQLDGRLWAQHGSRIKTAIGKFIHDAGTEPNSQKDVLSRQEKVVSQTWMEWSQDPNQLAQTKKWYVDMALGIIRQFEDIVNQWDDAPKPTKTKEDQIEEASPDAMSKIDELFGK
jgi:hypothetical protein